MTLKELNQAFWLQQEIAGLSRQLEEMRERASTIPSAGFDNMPHGSGPKISRTEKQAVEIVELESRLNEQKAAKEDALARIAEYIDSLEDAKLRYFCRLRFLKGQSWKEISYGMNYRFTDSAVRKYVMRYLPLDRE